MSRARAIEAIAIEAIIAAWLLLGPACTCGPQVSDVRASASVGSAGVVHFREWWARARSDGTVLACFGRYVLRSATPDELLFRREGEAQEISDNVFAVSTRNFTVRPASADEWSRAMPRQAFREIPPSALNLPAALGVVSHLGKAFPRRGNHWGVVLPSPDGAWLAVVSYDERDSFLRRLGRRWTRWCLFHECLEPRSGELFVDVFDVTTGTAVQSMRGRYADMEPQRAYGEAFWAGDGSSIFVMPLDPGGPETETCLLAVLPERHAERR